MWKTQLFWVGMQELEQAATKNDKRCRVVLDMCQDDEDREVPTQEFDVVRLKFFNFIAWDQ